MVAYARAKNLVRGTPLFPVLKHAQDLTPSALAARRARRDFYRQFVQPGDLVFDVGANLGNRVDAFLALGARVVAVEPQPFCVHALHARWGRNTRLTVLPIGLDEHPGAATLYVADSHVFSSFSADYARDTEFKGIKWDQGHEMQVSTLGNLTETFGLPAFTKIDVEGFEPNVLRGMGEQLPALSFEVNVHTPDVSKACVEVLGDSYEYAWSGGEGMHLDTSWMAQSEMLDHLGSLTDFGDVYARLHP